MRNEEYLFVQDQIDKKSVARSARHKRTHTGKGGSVKLPSDYLTKKEIAKMSGEVKSYRLNEPMLFKEFKQMPDDLQVAYIKAIQKKYQAPISAIAKMMHCDRANLNRYLTGLGIERDHKKGPKTWDKVGFTKWVYGVPGDKDEAIPAEEIPVEEPPVEEETPVVENPIEEIPNPGIKVNLIREEGCPAFAIPGTGNMDFEGYAKDIANTITMLLGNAKVNMSITWTLAED